VGFQFIYFFLAALHWSGFGAWQVWIMTKKIHQLCRLYFLYLSWCLFIPVKPAQYVTCMTTLQSPVSTINDLLLQFFCCFIARFHSATVVVFTVSCNFLFSFYDESTLPLCHLSVAVCDLRYSNALSCPFITLLVSSFLYVDIVLSIFVLWWGDFSWCFGAPYRPPEDV
jgi:hypothetical protein